MYKTAIYQAITQMILKKKINLVFMKNKRTNGEQAIKNFNLEKIAYKVIEVYKNILNNFS